VREEQQVHGAGEVHGEPLAVVESAVGAEQPEVVGAVDAVVVAVLLVLEKGVGQPERRVARHHQTRPRVQQRLAGAAERQARVDPLLQQAQLCRERHRHIVEALQRHDVQRH